MDVAVTGASGFIGRALVHALLARGDRVRALSRSPERVSAAAGVQAIAFDPMGAANASPFEGADAVIHLAGESVSGRWTDEKRRAIRESRVRGTRVVVESIAACAQRPSVLISASGAGYYGNRGDEPLLESSPPGSDFLAAVCVEWEREAQRAESSGLRVAWLRQGIVFGAGGGALKEMVPPFRAFAGGPYGNGSQFMPWIHLDDDIALYLFALDRGLSGPINAVSPDITTSARLAHAIGAALHRPALAYAPGLALHLVLGEFASTLLMSQLVLPDAAMNAGFTFTHQRLEEALFELLAQNAPSSPPVAHFEDENIVRAQLDRVYAFLCDPSNLAQITPPSVGFRLTSALPASLARGTVMEYALQLRGVPVRWKSMISDIRPGRSLVDYQLRGPYELWRHEHVFEEGAEGTTIVRDSIAYTLPFAPFSDLARPLAASELKRIFDFRRAAVARHFGQ